MAPPDRQVWKGAALNHFQRWADHYDRDIINIFLFVPCYRRVLCQLRHWQRRGLTRIRMLDIGCGTGTLATQCLKQSTQIESITGLDMSDNMISKARTKARRLGASGRLRFAVGDAEHLPFANSSFNVVTCCNSFHHYPHQDQALREMRRVLNPGGRLVLIDGSRDDPFGFFIFDICVARVEKLVHHCSAQRFRKLLRQAGFSEIEQRTFGVCPPAVINVARASK